MTKLTTTQEKVLAKMQDGEWHTAYELKCSLSTIGALIKKGYVEKQLHLGCIWFPRSCIDFRLKQKEQNETSTS